MTHRVNRGPLHGPSRGIGCPHSRGPRASRETSGVVPVSYSEYKETPARSLNSEGLPVHCYFVTDWTGTPRNLQKHEHSEIAWIRLAEAEKLELASPRMLSLLEAIDIVD
jgi:hypothetical protein